MTIAARLLEALSELPGPRLERGREPRWSELLFVAVCTLLAGGESCHALEDFAPRREEWLRTCLELPGGPPGHDPFNRLFQRLDPGAFAQTFARWTESLRAARPAGGREIVALAGQAARRALPAGENTRYLVSAWAAAPGLTLGQVPAADKSNFDHGGASAPARPGVEGRRGDGRRPCTARRTPPGRSWRRTPTPCSPSGATRACAPPLISTTSPIC